MTKILFCPWPGLYSIGLLAALAVTTLDAGSPGQALFEVLRKGAPRCQPNVKQDVRFEQGFPFSETLGRMMMIDPAIWPVLSSLLDEYLDQPEESRAVWLNRLGPEYAEVLPTLRELLARQTGKDEFLKTLPTLTASDPSPVHINAQFFAPGTIVGPYKLKHGLGRGGMSEVWLAERADGSVKRPVALKLPIVSMRNRTFAERFGRERDILAQLTHPQIARLYDAGVTAAGQSYLALEYVEGESITEYCDGKRLGLRPRLKLFLDVLCAVQYAHTNLIVHRDLKPANILVNRDGHVRLLDFGIAKLLVEGEAHETRLTQAGGRVLTPEYASAEQLAGAR